MEILNTVIRITSPPDWGPISPQIMEAWRGLVLPCVGRLNCMGKEVLLTPQEDALTHLKHVPLIGIVAYYWFVRKDYPSEGYYFCFPVECCELAQE
jgi:hypothetical protein